jgi:hypothetical protein
MVAIAAFDAITLNPSASPSPINVGRGVYEMAELVVATKRELAENVPSPDRTFARSSKR